MPRERLVVIGGVAAGMSAASRARRINPQMEIIVFEKGEHISYGTCGLPYYLSGQVADWRELIVYTPEFFRETRDIDVRLRHEVTAIKPGRKKVRVRKNATDEFELPYDKLVIATGGAPAVHIPGSELGGVFTCNDLAGTIRLRDYIESRRPQRAVIAGSGYIGLEVADAFASRGIAVAIFERSTEMVEGIEPEIAARIEAILEKHKVSFSRNATVTEVVGGSRGEAGAVHLADGKSEDCDLVLLATGIVPRTELAESAGVRLGATGAIEVDERMLTSVNAIYAAGDCTEVQHLVTGRRTYFPLGTTANKQGRVAGENASGGNATFAGVVGTLVTKVFELEVAKTGLSLAQARAHGFQPDKVAITSTSRAKYFHGKPLDVTLVWDRTSGRLLGCQMAGQEGAAKRIDVAAMALHARMRIPEMLHLDLSYAPPFAPVWEAILIAAHEADKRLGR